MRTDAMKAFIGLARDKDGGPLAKAVAAAVDGDALGPRALKQALLDAGFTAKNTKLKHLHQVEVSDKEGELVARGSSDSSEDALMQAMYAALREESAAQKQRNESAKPVGG